VPDRYPAIEDHAVIGDLHTVALVATDGTIDWCCLPRFDSPAVFASLLDADHGGSFAVRSEAVRTRQLYKPATNVLVTRFLGTDSVGEVVDFMVPRHPGSPLTHPGPLLVRRLRAVRGTVVFRITCRPAFDFGRQDHAVHAPGHGGAVFTSPGTRAGLVLRASQRFSVAGHAAPATVTLGPGEGLDLLLEWGGRPQPPAEGEATGLLDYTVAYWRNWLRRSRYQGRYREMVERSALVLKLMVYQPTGALVAAPTTQRDGWSPDRRAYVQHLGGTTLDASLLVMPLVKFAGPSDPRFLATLDRIGEELVSDSLVRRYEPDGSDGLPGSEGTFNLCSFWYVEALTRAGRIAEGRYVFEKMLTYANHVGLFAEEIGPAGEALGNFPQAFTHLALISAACNLDRALSGELPPP
jgi:GH15 family glucan-1,4-alpha-glucosidase